MSRPEKLPSDYIGLFALAGLACSGFFPLTIGLVSKRFPRHAAWVSSMMIAALMIGVGLGSFVISPLRQWLTLEQLYQGSTIYPLAALALAFLAVQWRPRAVLASAQPQSLFSSDCGASRSPIEGNQCGIVGPISHR